MPVTGEIVHQLIAHSVLEHGAAPGDGEDVGDDVGEDVGDDVGDEVGEDVGELVGVLDEHVGVGDGVGVGTEEGGCTSNARFIIKQNWVPA